MGFVDGLNMRCERKRGVRDDYKFVCFFNFSSWINGI